MRIQLAMSGESDHGGDMIDVAFAMKPVKSVAKAYAKSMAMPTENTGGRMSVTRAVTSGIEVSNYSRCSLAITPE
jgi:hypothetical protein